MHTCAGAGQKPRDHRQRKKAAPRHAVAAFFDPPGRPGCYFQAVALVGCRSHRRLYGTKPLPSTSTNPPNSLEITQFFEVFQAAMEKLPSLNTATPSADTTSILPPLHRFTEAELQGAALHPKCIVDNLLYADLALVSAPGGTGKTTLLLHEAVCIALGHTVWGCRVVNPGRTVIFTAEDSRDLYAGRLREIMGAMGLNEIERATVIDSVLVLDVSGDMMHLARLDGSGNLVLTGLADAVVNEYRDLGLVQIVFDPLVSFGPGERLVNDGLQAVVTACRRIVRGLNCCVRLVSHSGQASARNGSLDQYSSRGGTALPDGCRMVTAISAVTSETSETPPDGWDLQPGESGFIMARAKLSYTAPLPKIWVRRRGYSFEHFTEQRQNSDEIRERDTGEVLAFLTDEIHHGRRYTANTLEKSGRFKISRNRLRMALAELQVSGRTVERDFPQEDRKGGKKTYLHPINLAANVGGIDPENTPAPATTPPDSTTSPPYRKRNGGEVDATVPISIFCTSPNMMAR